MKISKLFHWLYGFVMLLPIFAVLSACLISTFNMSAKEESEIHYRYQTNEVNSNEDLILGNVYDFNYEYDSDSIDFYIVFEIIDGYIEFEANYIGIDEDIQPIYLYSNWYIGLDTSSEFNLFLGTSDNYIATNVSQVTTFKTYDCTIKLLFISEVSEDLSTYLSSSSFNVIESVETNNVGTQDIFYNAIDKVKRSPLFSWAYDSFLVAPFSYIVSVFSMPANSFVVQMLSYWLAISIIWLVFDLVMYVPLLVHRWLDKGVLE